MRKLFGALRIIAGLAGLISVIATYVDSASRAVINPFNFFGYFTIQSNIIVFVVLLISGTLAVAGRVESARMQLIRGCATTYIVIVGVVYNTLLVGLPGGIELAWANSILHFWIPLYVAIDWILFGDRDALPWRRFWVVLIYPIVWLVVILVRGATDGFVPYPFLNPSTGYASVALYCVAIAVGIAVTAVGVWAMSRVRIIKP